MQMRSTVCYLVVSGGVCSLITVLDNIYRKQLEKVGRHANKYCGCTQGYKYSQEPINAAQEPIGGAKECPTRHDSVER